MRTDLAEDLGECTRPLTPLWAIASRVDYKNWGMAETNLLSLSFGRIIRKNIEAIGGLRPESYETYNIIEPGDVVLRMTDLQNDQKSIRTGQASERGIITSAYITIRPDRSKADPRFLLAALQAYDIQKTYYRMGAGVRQSLGWTEFTDLPVPMPELKTQQRIADYLDRETGEIDAMVTKMEELEVQLTEWRQSIPESLLKPLFESATAPLWSFLIPVKDQNHPHEEVLSVYREFGVIPKSSRDDNHNRTPEDLSAYQLVLQGDLVINKMKAWQGSMGVSEHRGIVSPDYQVARPDNTVDSRYLHTVLRSRRMINQYRVRSKGVRPSQWRLYWNDFADLEIPLPPIDEQRRIADRLDETTLRIDTMLAKVSELKVLLAERRSALIADVVTGRKIIA